MLFRVLSTKLEFFEDLSSFMATTLTNKNDNIVETGSNKAAKSYKLLKSTRTTFALCNSKIIRSLFLPILKLVDNYFYDNAVPQVGKNRYEEAFIEWCRITTNINANMLCYINWIFICYDIRFCGCVFCKQVLYE